MIGQLVGKIIATSKRMRERTVDVLGLISSIPNTLKDISRLRKHPLSLMLDEHESYFELPKRLQKQWESNGTLERHRTEIEDFLKLRDDWEEKPIKDDGTPKP